MEFSEKVIRGERILLACFLALLAPILWLENRSPLCAAIRLGQPLVFWLQFDQTGAPEPAYALAVYQPARRVLDLIHVVPQTASRRSRPMTGTDEASLLAEMPLAGIETPLATLYIPDKGAVGLTADLPLDEKETLVARTQGLRFWKELRGQFLKSVAVRSALPPLDRLILAAELHRLRPEDLRASWLPESDEDRRTLFGHILTPPAPLSAEPVAAITAEVLNGTGRQGVASQAKDVLRLQGVDVVNVGNLPNTNPRTVVYDRTGRVENAQAVRDKLGCPGAQTVTEVSPKKLVEVTVVLGEDCPDPGRKGGAWNSLRF